jgi:phospholipase C
MGKALGGVKNASRSNAVMAVLAGFGVALGAMAIDVLTPIAAEAKTPPTTTPIKHLIVVIGENRSFDNVFGTYVPPPGQSVWNLLSQGIVNKTGAPGLNAARALQRQATSGRRATSVLSFDTGSGFRKPQGLPDDKRMSDVGRGRYRVRRT